jgi:hypothetical protein
MLLVKLKPADVACGKATLRTSPSCGQTTISFQLRHPKLLACHSRAEFDQDRKNQAKPMRSFAGNSFM